MSIKEAAVNTPTELSLSRDDASEIVYPKTSQIQLAWRDITDGMKNWRIWLTLAYQDIKLRYRRSVLGPFWITISMAITVYTMGFLYGHLFHMDLQQYYPYLVGGMLTWALISSAITELTDTFITSDGLLKQIKLPYSLYVHRIIARNMIIFFHNLLVIVPIYVIFHEGAKINWYTLLFVPGLIFLYLNALIFGLILAMIGARYRDISQIIKSLIQVVFFATPIMWNPMILPEKDRIFVYLNPAYSYVELIRAPLLGTAPTLLNIGVTAGMAVAGGLVCMKLFTRYRSRIIYWL
jgi:ABC-type polysaccharide/polyol phosphate export permease